MSLICYVASRGNHHQYGTIKMNRRELVIGGVTAVFGTALGVSVVPKNPVAETPLETFHQRLCGFLIHRDSGHQSTAFYHVAHLPNMKQAIIFNGQGENAKVIGIEYIISERLYDELPSEEKQLWHPHRFEVESGLLAALGQQSNLQVANEYKTTWGKAVYTWPDPNTRIPTGQPRVMAPPTQLAQVDEQRIRERDADLNINTATIASQRQPPPSRYGRGK